MRGYVMVGSSDLKESKAFYDVVLAVMGIVSIYEDEVCVGYAREGKQDVEFYITKPANGDPATFGFFLTCNSSDVGLCCANSLAPSCPWHVVSAGHCRWCSSRCS